MRTSQIWWHQFYILSIQMTRNRHWHIFNPNDIRGDVRTIQNNSIEYYTITASLLHIVQVAPNIIWVGQTPSRHIFNPITTTNGARTIPNDFLMVKIGIGCHLFILNTIHCPGGPKYYFNRTQILHSFGILPIHSVSILYDNCCRVSRHSVDLLRLIHCTFRANGSDRYSVLYPIAPIHSVCILYDNGQSFFQ